MHLKDEVEQELRVVALEKFGLVKGALSKTIEYLLHNSEHRNTDKIDSANKILARIKTGCNFTGWKGRAYRKRSDIYGGRV